MSVSIGNDSMYLSSVLNTNNATKSSKIEDSLNKDLAAASDEELLESCRSFESYLVEQVVKQVKKSMTNSDEEENSYISYFGDMLYTDISEKITESGELGIANQLFQAMKRNQ